MAAAFFHALFEFEEIAIEIVERFPLDFMATLACRFPISKARATSIVRAAVLIDGAANDLTMGEVGRFYGGAAKEFLRGGGHRAVTISNR